MIECLIGKRVSIFLASIKKLNFQLWPLTIFWAFRFPDRRFPNLIFTSVNTYPTSV